MSRLNSFISRRAALASILLTACAPRGSAPQPNDDRVLHFDERVQAIEARIGGRIGVAALNTANGASLGYRADERFAMCSMFKWLLAARFLQLNQNQPGLLQ